MSIDVDRAYHDAQCRRRWGKRDPKRCRRCRQLDERDGVSSNTPIKRGVSTDVTGDPKSESLPPCPHCGRRRRYLTIDQAAE